MLRKEKPLQGVFFDNLHKKLRSGDSLFKAVAVQLLVPFLFRRCKLQRMVIWAFYKNSRVHIYQWARDMSLLLLESIFSDSLLTAFCFILDMLVAAPLNFLVRLANVDFLPAEGVAALAAKDLSAETIATLALFRIKALLFSEVFHDFPDYLCLFRTYSLLFLSSSKLPFVIYENGKS